MVSMLLSAYETFDKLCSEYLVFREVDGLMIVEEQAVFEREGIAKRQDDLITSRDRRYNFRVDPPVISGLYRSVLL